MTKEILLETLDRLLGDHSLLLAHIDNIHNVRSHLRDLLTPEEDLAITNRIKDKFQKEANKAIDDNKGNGLIVAGTGSGKSKIAIKRITDVLNNNTKILLVVPTEKLRDKGWKDEFEKWGAGYNNITAICYASLHTLIDTQWNIVIMDEAHNLSEANSKFFELNSIKSVIGLTATEPRDRQKIKILESIGCKKIYELTLDQSIKLGIVAPYDITVVTLSLDNKDRYIKAGSKAKPFMTTEFGQYAYLTRLDLNNPTKWTKLNRYKFFCNCKTKTEAAIKILQYIIPEDKRTLIFCGSKDQANRLNPYRFYSKPKKKDNPNYEKQIAEYQGDSSLNLFLEGKINRLSCVNALNEGHNLGTDLDCAFMPQIDSNPLSLIQRAGRILRWRQGHTGKIIILTVKDTVDLEWTNKVLRGLNSAKVSVVDIEKLRSGEEIIKFN